jgi:hypothetical protein
VNSTQFLIESVASEPSFRWLGQEDWFAIAPTWPRNPIIDAVRRMAAVADRLSIDEIRAGIERATRGRVRLPESVLTALLASTPEVEQLQAGMRNSEAAMNDAADILSASEKALADILLSQGGTADIGQLRQHWRLTGLTMEALFHTLSRSPIVTRIGRGRHSLVGSRSAAVASPAHQADRVDPHGA